MGLLEKLFPNVIHETLVRTLSTSFESTRELKKKEEKYRQKEKRLLKSIMELLERVNILNIQSSCKTIGKGRHLIIKLTIHK